MKPFHLLFFLLVSLSISAQQGANLPGKWSFQNVHDQEKLDSTSVKMLDMLFGNMSLVFSESGIYKAHMLGEEDKGSWELVKADNGLVLKSDTGNNHRFEIIELSDQQLTLKLSRGVLVFKRTGDAPELAPSSPSKNIKSVKVTANEISKKWYLKRKESPGKTQAQIDMLSNMIAGAYFDFREDGTFEVSIMNITESGDWKLGDEHSSVITMKDGSSKVWNIQAISEKELILNSGNTEEKWIFSSTE